MSTSERTVNWYNEHADDYAQHVGDPNDSIYHAYYEKPAIRAELPDISGLSVLSIGCGSGVDTQFLKDKGAAQSAGVDISEKLIAIARKDYPNCEFQVMDMEKLDFPDASFDLVYSSLAIHYPIGGPAKTFDEVARVLKPGGVFLFSDAHPIDSGMQIVHDDAKTRDKRLGKLKDKETDTEQVFGDYLTPRAITIEEGLAVQFWHQPLSATINQLIEAGFVLDKIVEFEPSEEMKTLSPRNYERLKRIPEMVVFKAHKS